MTTRDCAVLERGQGLGTAFSPVGVTRVGMPRPRSLGARDPRLCAVGPTLVGDHNLAGAFTHRAGIRRQVAENAPEWATVKSTGRISAWVLIVLAITGVGVGIGLSLSLSGSETGVLTGEIRLTLGGPVSRTVSPGPGTVTIGALEPVDVQGRTCDLCQVPTVATQTVARGRDFRFALPTGSYDVFTKESYSAFAPCSPPTRVAIRSGKTLSIVVNCVSTVG